MDTDEWIHSDDDTYAHISSPDCWCVPVRVRKNGLSGKVEHWDRSAGVWVAIEDLPDLARAEFAVSEPEVLDPADLPGMPESNRKVEDEIADRAAMQEEDRFWKGLD